MQLRRFLSDPLKLRIFNVTMAVVLVATLYPVVFGPASHKPARFPEAYIFVALARSIDSTISSRARSGPCRPSIFTHLPGSRSL